MELFKVTKFDSNKLADAACKEIFSKLKTLKHKNIPLGNLKKCTNQSQNVRKNRRKQKEKVVSNSLHLESVEIKNQRIKPSQILPQEKLMKVKRKKGKKKMQNRNTLQGMNNLTDTHSESKNEVPRVQNKQSKKKDVVTSAEDCLSEGSILKKTKKESRAIDYKREKLNEKLQQTSNAPLKNQISQQVLNGSTKNRKRRILPLRQRMMEKLQAARFRFINEKIYSSDSKQAQKIFAEDPESFRAYHEGFRQQVNKWPLNPLDIIIKSIQKMPKTHVIADFGCGEAELAKSVEQTVHSFDLVAVNESVISCDMAHVPLQNSSVDVAVFCLSLMGTNLNDYILEANRVLKPGGILKIAEVESRFEDVHKFVAAVQKFNFKNTWKDLSHNLFYFLDFKKESDIKNKKKISTISLYPCLYKKR
jgi:ribosomal RNA-processing protein 8